MSEVSFPYSNVSKILKEASGLRVSKPAVEAARAELVRHLQSVAAEAGKVSREDGRSTISDRHLVAALKAMAGDSTPATPA